MTDDDTPPKGDPNWQAKAWQRIGRDLVAEGRKHDAAMTDGPWEVWTSNSFRRITAHRQQDGGVLSGAVQRDGQPDLAGRNRDADLAGIAFFGTHRRALIEIAERALDEVDRLESARELDFREMDRLRRIHQQSLADWSAIRSENTELREHRDTYRDRAQQLATELGELKLVLEQQDRDMERMRAGLTGIREELQRVSALSHVIDRLLSPPSAGTLEDECKTK